MNYQLYTTIIWILTGSVWLYLAYRAISGYLKILRLPEVSAFMTKWEVEQIKDPKTREAIKSWNKLILKLFLIWVLTAVPALIFGIVTRKTIGLTNTPVV